MKHITIRDIVRVTEGKLIVMGRSGDSEIPEEVPERELTDLCIDSREIKKGDLFIPLLGERVDAHKFIPGVMSTAVATLTDWDADRVYADPGELEKAGKREDILIRVENTQKALEQIGAYIRTQYEPPVIGVTGSVGKTTTRRMIATALGSCREVFETPGNLNSHIGIPITTSRMLDEPSEVAVLEMGIDRIGEMDVEYSIVRPEIAVVTMIGVCHMEYFGSREGIRREKLKVAGHDTVLFLNADDPMLMEIKGKTEAREVWYYGVSEEAEYRAEDMVQTDDGYRFIYVHGDIRVLVELPVAGMHNVRNAVVAMAIADYLGMDLEKAAASLAGFQGLRQIIRHSGKGTTIIDDTYNASPDSMKAALTVLSDYKTEGRRWAVLGDMFEMGPREKEFHKEVGEGFSGYKVDRLITVGELAGLLGEKAHEVNKEMQYYHFAAIEDAAEYLKKELREEDVVLFKASHGMNFSKLVEWLE